MDRYVEIINELPSTLQCKGFNYNETKDLSMKEVSMFIERDIHCFLKRLTDLKPTLSVSLVKLVGIWEVRVEVNISDINASGMLRRKIEGILWSYNHQVFLQSRGQLIPQTSRFHYVVEIAEHVQVKPVVESMVDLWLKPMKEFL